MAYYRLAQKENTLPLHWAYSDAWEYRCDEQGSRWVDNRAEGFQVFGEANQVIQAAWGTDMDGSYLAADYPQLLVIEADSEYVEDGCSLFYAVHPDGVKSIRGVKTQDAIDKIYELFLSQKEEYSYDSFEEWCGDSDEEIQEILQSISCPVEINFIETLPCP